MKSDSHPWRPTRLGDVIELRRGVSYRGDDLHGNGGLVGLKCVVPGGGFRRDGVKPYSGPAKQQHRLAAGDLVVALTDITQTGDVLGRPSVVPGDLDHDPLVASLDVARIDVRSSVLEPRFLFYLMCSASFRQAIWAHARGTTVRRVPRQAFEDVEVRLPDKREQQRIVAVLGALDDKIENNRRLAGLLEEAAGTMFRARFIDFVGVDQFANSDIGPVPSGWTTQKIGEWGRVITGATPSTKDPENFDGPYPFITIGDLREQVAVITSARTLSERGAASIAGRLLPPDSVMMSCIATVGECGLTTVPSFTNQQINSVVCDEPSDARFLYFVFKNLRHELESHGGGGSVYTNVSRARFAAIATVCPPHDALREFDEIAAPLIAMTTHLAREGMTLIALRDALLPRLISGAISISDTQDTDEVIDPVADKVGAAS